MNRSLLRRHLAYALAIAVTAAALAVYTGSLLGRVTERESRAKLVELAELVGRALVRENPTLSELDAFAKELGVPGLRVTLIREDGVVIGDTQADPAGLENHADRAEVRDARSGVIGFAQRFSSSVGQELAYAALPASSHRGVSLIIRVSAPAAVIRSQLREARLAIVVASVLILAFVTLLTYRAERRMIDPILQLERAASAYADGRFDYGLRVTWPPDLAHVAMSMRGMAQALKERITESTSRTRELEAILASMTEAVVVLDQRLEIRSLNQAAAKLAQITETQARGRTLLEVFRNTDLNEFARGLLTDPAPQEGTLTLEGSIHVQAHGARLRALDTADDGGEAGIVLVLSDISRLRRLEEVRRDFVANVSHELKTPITAIKGYLETLLGGALDDPKTARQFTETAARHADRLGAIVEDLLSLSRLEERAQVLGDLEPCDLGAIARTAVEGFHARAKKKRLTLETRIGVCPRVMGNPRLLEQALANLIDNAIKYTDAGGTITVATSHRPPDAVLVVTDTGIGIAAKDLGRVFERFYRVDKDRSRDLGGTGLGLSVVRHIALAHGGSVEAVSTPGAGSTFTLRIPADPGAAPEA